MRAKHNVLLVTNDHVSTLTGMADNTITVSALDRAKVKVGQSSQLLPAVKPFRSLAYRTRDHNRYRACDHYPLIPLRLDQRAGGRWA